MTPRAPRDEPADEVGAAAWDDDGADEWTAAPYNDAHIVYYADAWDDAHDADGTLRVDDDRAWAAPVSSWLDRLWWRGRLIINTMAFITPLLLLAGLLLIAARADRSDSSTETTGQTPVAAATTPVVGAWPTDVIFAANTVPAMIKDLIAASGARHGYRFEGQAGAVWTLTAEPLDGSALNPALAVYTPSGELLVANDDRYTGDSTAEITFTLPADGAYRVVVEASGGASTGDYLFTLFEQ